MRVCVCVLVQVCKSYNLVFTFKCIHTYIHAYIYRGNGIFNDTFIIKDIRDEALRVRNILDLDEI